MDLIALLKKLKRIEADPEYVRNSRRLILGTLPAARPASFGALILQSLQAGSTIALAGILLLLVIGGFSVGQLLSPFQVGSLNPKSLEAEAHAIDIQIKLTDLSYEESTAAIAPREAPAPTIAPAPLSADVQKEIQKEAEKLGITVSTSSETVTLDEALEELSK